MNALPAAAHIPRPARRRVLTGLAGVLWLAGLTQLTACGSLGGWGGPFPTLSEARLNELLARRFPYTRGFAGLAELSLLSPRVHLLPETNRLGTQLELALLERVTGARYSGAMDLDYGLRFDPLDGSLHMQDVRVHRLDIDQLPRAQQKLLSQFAPRVAEHLLNDMVLYRVPAEQLARARSLGLEVSGLRVLPQGLQVETRAAALR